MNIAYCAIICLFLLRYQKDLNAAIEREALLEQSKSQLNIDWQKRYESAEREGFQKSESLVQKLTKARDEVK